MVPRSARSCGRPDCCRLRCGAAITVIPIRYVIETSGYELAFLWFGLIQGGIVFILAWFLRSPEPGELDAIPAPKVAQSSRNYNPKEVLSSPVFWLLYVLWCPQAD